MYSLLIDIYIRDFKKRYYCWDFIYKVLFYCLVMLRVEFMLKLNVREIFKYGSLGV